MVPDSLSLGTRRDTAYWRRIRVSGLLSRLWLMWLSGTIISSIPFLVVGLPPLDQHFFNIVRLEILAHPATYARHFEISWDVMPDLALDLIVPKTAGLVSVERLTWLLLLTTLALLTSGTLVLSRVVNRRWSLLPLVSFLFLYNWILVRGYENNLLGLGICLWALAAHIALRRSAWARAAASSCSAVVLYFCHLFPLGVFAVAAGVWELGCLLQAGLSLRRVLKHAGAALLPLVVPVFLLWLSSTGELGGVVEFGILRVWTKAKLCLEAFTIGNRQSDVVLLASLGVSAVLAAGRGWLECEPECRAAVVLLPLVAFMAPLYAFASWGITERYGISLAFLMVAFLRLRPVDLRLQRATGIALALVFLFRIDTITADWRNADGIIQEYRAAFASLEPGSVLFQFDQDTRYVSPLREPDLWNPPLDKIVALATLNGVLVPELYLKRGQQPVLYRQPDASLRVFQYGSDQRQSGEADDVTLRAWLTELSRRFPDLRTRFREVYIAVYDPHGCLSPSLPGTEFVRSLREHRLYKISPSPS